ncbi:MAG: response regulator transcription factor [Acidimicrobiia bacterium]|nr:MAG: response regulator transcription factor [Acidimicrobiia bacterium]
MNTPIRVVIADDHQLMLDGLKQGLNSLPDIRVVGTAVDGSTLGDVVASTEPDVLLVDVEMPGMSGISAISRLDDLPPTIVVTMHTAEAYGKSAREAGAVAFLSKALPLPDLAAAIRAVADGQHLFDRDLDQALADYRTPRLSTRAETITERERDVLRCLVQGISGTEDLADELYISQKTVKNHLASIYEKLSVNDRAQAVVEAMKLGLDRKW